MTVAPSAPPENSFPLPSRGRVAILVVVVLVVIGGLMALSDLQSPTSSSYPTLRHADATGQLTGSTDLDVVFYLNCVRAVPSGAMRPSGFWKLPSAHVRFELVPPSGTTAARVRESTFLTYVVRHHPTLQLFLADGRATVTDAAAPVACTLPSP